MTRSNSRKVIDLPGIIEREKTPYKNTMATIANYAQLASRLCDEAIDAGGTSREDLDRSAELIASARVLINNIGFFADHFGGEQKGDVREWLMAEMSQQER